MTEKEKIMLKNIVSCKDIFAKMLTNRDVMTRDFVELFKSQPIKRVYLSGHGSPWNAAEVMKIMLINILKVDTTCEIPTLFNNHEGFNIGGYYKPEEMLLICPAGTGKTKGPIIAAENAKKLGIKVVVSSTEQTGRLYRLADVYVDKLAGEEINFPDCKGHLSTLFLYAMSIIDAAYALDRIDKEKYDYYNNTLKYIADNHINIINSVKKWYQHNKEMLVTATNIRILGNGANYGTATEGALKLSEGTGIQAIGWEMEQYFHGPILSLNKNDILFVIGSKDVELSKTRKITKLIKDAMCPNTVFISKKEDAVDGVNSINSLFVDDPILSALQYVVVFQVLTTLTARDRGHSTVDVISGYDKIDLKLETRYYD